MVHGDMNDLRRGICKILNEIESNPLSSMEVNSGRKLKKIVLL
jgi:hypothetical protein